VDKVPASALIYFIAQKADVYTYNIGKLHSFLIGPDIFDDCAAAQYLVRVAYEEF